MHVCGRFLWTQSIILDIDPEPFEWRQTPEQTRLIR